MITVDLQLSGLPIRQHVDQLGDDVFALSADDGANLTDDDEGLMETYGDGSPPAQN